MMRKRWRVLIGVLLLLLLAVGILWVYVRKRLDDESKAAAAILVAWNDKVAFYGKVVDQHDQPVQGVKVSIRLSGWNRGFLRGGRGLQNRMEFIRHTDAKGRFGIENQDGTSLGIGRDSFHKEGYINPIHLPKGGGSFFYGGYYLEDEKHHPDPDQPVVYRMWKRSADPPRRLIKRKSGYHCKMNGKWHGRDLITWERLSLKDPRADLILSARIEEQGEDPDVYDWELTLEMLEGGIQATDDAHLFLAPKDGYEKKIVIKRRFPDCFRNNYDYQGGFYLRSYEGRVHASVYIWATIRRDWSDHGDVITLDYVWLINPFGSRSLEYDPERHGKLQALNRAGKLGDEEYMKLVYDEDPVRDFDEEELKAIVELLQQGETPKAKDYQ